MQRDETILRFSEKKMSEQIKVLVNGKELTAKAGSLISDILNTEKPCGGHGRCGKCKVWARGELSALTEEERKLLSDKELSDGVRLACLTYALGDCTVSTITHSERSQIVTDGILPNIDLKPTFEHFGVAIDVGTTTLASRLYDRSANVLAEYSCLNPQKAWGADVISRIEASLGGHAEELREAIRIAINDIITKLSGMAQINARDIDRFLNYDLTNAME